MNTALNRTQVVLLTNKSGGSLAQGDVGIVDSANASAVTTTTTSGFVNGQVAVVLDPAGIANNASGAFAIGGYIPKINLSGSASLGDVFKTHTVAKQAVRHAAPLVAGDFGIVLATGTTPAAILFGGVNQGGGSTVDDTAYDATSWNGDTTHAPSKNAVRDKIETMSAGGVTPPGSLSNLLIWLKADAITGKSDNDTLDYFEDSSGLAHPYTAYGSPVYKTNILNSLPIIRFASASSQFLRGWFPTNLPSFCWAMVFKITSLTPAYTSLLSYNAISDSGGYLIKSNGKSAEYFGANSYDGTGAITFGTSAFNYVISNHKATTFDTRVSGAADKTGTTHVISNLPLQETDIGNHPSGSRFFSGDIAEFIVFGRGFTSAEITTLESYITGKYAL